MEFITREGKRINKLYLPRIEKLEKAKKKLKKAKKKGIEEEIAFLEGAISAMSMGEKRMRRPVRRIVDMPKRLGAESYKQYRKRMGRGVKKKT